MASKHMVRSRNYSRAIEARAKASIAAPVALGKVLSETVIPADILEMPMSELGKALTHARRSRKVPAERKRQLQAEWAKRLAALDS